MKRPSWRTASGISCTTSARSGLFRSMRYRDRRLARFCEIGSLEGRQDVDCRSNRETRQDPRLNAIEKLLAIRHQHVGVIGVLEVFHFDAGMVADIRKV